MTRDFSHIAQASKTHSSQGMKSSRGCVLVGAVSHQLSAPTAQLMCGTGFVWVGKERERNEQRRTTCRDIYSLNFFSLFLALKAKQKKGDRKNHTVKQIEKL